MKIKITKWSEIENAFTCDYEGETGKLIDLFVDGTLDKRYKNPESLIGREAEVEWLHPFIQIAHNVKLLPKFK